jgi:hypothetical protein
MSCFAVLITQHINSDLKAATQPCSMICCQNILLTKSHRSMIFSAAIVASSSLQLDAGMKPFNLYSLDLNRLLNQLPLTAEVGGRYCSSSAVLSHDMSPRTWLRSVMPQSLMAVSSSSRRTVTSSVDFHSPFSNTTYYQHNAPLLPCRT